MYIFIFDGPTCQVSKVRVFKNDAKQTIVEIQQAMQKEMDIVFFRNMGLIKAIKYEGS